MNMMIITQKVAEFLKSDKFVDEINVELKRSRQELGVTGVPTFIINEKERFSGGRAPDFFLMTFQSLGLYKFKAADFDDDDD